MKEKTLFQEKSAMIKFNNPKKPYVLKIIEKHGNYFEIEVATNAKLRKIQYYQKFFKHHIEGISVQFRKTKNIVR